MKRSTSVTLCIIPLLVTALSGCAEDEEVNADYSQVCVEDDTDIRVEDNNCDTDSTGSHWVWFPHHLLMPPVGDRINPAFGVTTKPTSGTIARPPAKGGFGTFRSGLSSGG